MSLFRQSSKLPYKFTNSVLPWIAELPTFTALHFHQRHHKLWKLCSPFLLMLCFRCSLNQSHTPSTSCSRGIPPSPTKTVLVVLDAPVSVKASSLICIDVGIDLTCWISKFIEFKIFERSRAPFPTQRCKSNVLSSAFSITTQGDRWNGLALR
jgi:hypothetical protein